MSVTRDPSAMGDPSQGAAFTWRCGCGMVRQGVDPCGTCGWQAPEIDPATVSGQAVSGQAVSGQAVSGQAVSGQAVSGQAVSGQALAGQAVPGGATDAGPSTGRPAWRRGGDAGTAAPAGAEPIEFGVGALPYATGANRRRWAAITGISLGGLTSKALPIMAILAATSVVALVVSRSDTNVHPDGVGLSAETAARGRAGGAVTTAKAAKGGSDDKGATTTAVDTSTPPATSPRSFPVGASGNPELIPVLLAPPLPGFTPSADGFAQLAEPALDPTNLPAGATHTVVRAWAQGEVILSETAFDSANPFDAAARLDTLVQAFRTRSGAASVPLPNGLNGSVTSLPRGSGTLTVVALRHVSRDFVILIASPGPGPDPATIIGLAQAQDAAS